LNRILLAGALALAAGGAAASPSRVSILAAPGLLADPYGDLAFNPAYVNMIDGGLIFLDASGEDQDSSDEHRQSAKGHPWLNTYGSSRHWRYAPVVGIAGRIAPFAAALEYSGSRERSQWGDVTEDFSTDWVYSYSSWNTTERPYLATLRLGWSFGDAIQAAALGSASELSRRATSYYWDGRITSRSHAHTSDRAFGGGVTVRAMGGPRLGLYATRGTGRSDATSEFPWGLFPFSYNLVPSNSWASHTTDTVGLTAETNPAGRVNVRSYVQAVWQDGPTEAPLAWLPPYEALTVDSSEQGLTAGLAAAIKREGGLTVVPSVTGRFWVTRTRDRHTPYAWDPGQFTDSLHRSRSDNVTTRLGVEFPIVSEVLILRGSLSALYWYCGRETYSNYDSTMGWTYREEDHSDFLQALGGWYAVGLGFVLSPHLGIDLDLSENLWSRNQDARDEGPPLGGEDGWDWRHGASHWLTFRIQVTCSFGSSSPAI